MLATATLAQNNPINLQSYTYSATDDIVLPGRLVTGRFAPFLVVLDLAEGNFQAPVTILPGTALSGSWEIDSISIPPSNPARLEIRIAHPDNPGFVQTISNAEFLPSGSLIVVPEGGLRFSEIAGNQAQFSVYIESLFDGFPMTSLLDVILQIETQMEIEPQMNAVGGAWSSAARDGEGLIIDRLEGAESAVVFYFTYADNGDQQWYIGVGDISGNQISIPELIVTRGGIFGDEFDPSQVERIIAGSMIVTMPDCDSIIMNFLINEVPGEYTLNRTYLASGQICQNQRQQHSVLN